MNIVNNDDNGDYNNGEANDALESSVGIYSVAPDDDAKNWAVEFIGTIQSGQHSSFDRECMMKKTKEELGHTADEPQITRGYRVLDTGCWIRGVRHGRPVEVLKIISTFIVGGPVLKCEKAKFYDSCISACHLLHKSRSFL